MMSKIRDVLNFVVTLGYGMIYLGGAMVIAFPDATTALSASMGTGAVGLLLATEALFGSAYPKIPTEEKDDAP